jgi:hypothetical protein
VLQQPFYVHLSAARNSGESTQESYLRYLIVTAVYADYDFRAVQQQDSLSLPHYGFALSTNDPGLRQLGLTLVVGTEELLTSIRKA